MEISTQKEHLVAAEAKENGIIKISLKGASPAGVTIKNGERLTILYFIEPNKGSSGKSCLVDVEVKSNRLIITASRLDDVELVKR